MFGIGKDHWAQSRQIFEDQFELSGQDYLYRRWQKGPPILVTAAERRCFIEDYGRRLRYSNWGIFGGLLLFSALVVGWTVQSGSDFPDIPIYFGISVIAVAGIAYILRAGTAPARELGRRAVLGPARSRVEMRRVMLSKMTYGQLATTSFAGAILPFILRGDQDVFSGWGRLWLLFSGLIILLAIVQAFRKWRFDRENKSDWR